MKYLKHMNEGGGSSINLTTIATIRILWTLTNDMLKRKYISGISDSDLDDSFDATSYYDGMDQVRTEGLLWLDDIDLVRVSTSFLKDLKTEEESETADEDGNTRKLTVEDYLNQNPNIEMKVSLFCNIKYEDTLSRRAHYEDEAIIEEIDDITDIELTYNFGIYTSWLEDNTETTEEFIKDNAPIIRATDHFNNFYKSVFDYDDDLREWAYEDYKQRQEENEEEDEYGSSDEYEITESDQEIWFSQVIDNYRISKQ